MVVQQLHFGTLRCRRDRRSPSHSLAGMAKEFSVRKVLFVLLTLSFCGAFASENSPSNTEYSTEPLKQPIFDPAYVAVDIAKFNNWLNANYEKLSPERMKGPREHLYYLLSSHVSEIYQREGTILPKEPDPILELMFFWAEKLGAFGGNLVYNKIKSTKNSSLSETTRQQGEFSIDLVEDTFVLTSKSLDWTLRFPYYFLVGELHDYVATNEMHTQITVISTGASRDRGERGHSQATIMFIYSPSAELTPFKNYWLNQLNLPRSTATKDLKVKGLSSQYTFDSNSLLHKEATFWLAGSGSYAVVYLGIDGTYQTNRVHFINFLENLGVS